MLAALYRTITIDQSQYVLQRFDMSDCKSVGSPADPAVPLFPFIDQTDVLSHDPYQEAVGSL